MKTKTLFTGLFIALFFTGCAQLRQNDSEQPLAYTYSGSSERLFETALATLKSDGFTIALADKERGLIQTSPIHIDEQTALALFDKTLNACNSTHFSIRLTISELSKENSQLSVKLLSNDKSNGILEQTLLGNVAVKLEGNDALTFSKIDVTKMPIVRVSMKDNSTVEGYLLDDTQRGYLRLKLKSGGIMHIERDDIDRYTLASESSSGKN